MNFLSDLQGFYSLTRRLEDQVHLITSIPVCVRERRLLANVLNIRSVTQELDSLGDELAEL